MYVLFYSAPNQSLRDWLARGRVDVFLITSREFDACKVYVNTQTDTHQFNGFIRAAGLEPARLMPQGLNLVCLPVPLYPLTVSFHQFVFFMSFYSSIPLPDYRFRRKKKRRKTLFRKGERGRLIRLGIYSIKKCCK